MQDGKTPLSIACLSGHSEVVDRLIAARAMVDAADKVLPLTRPRRPLVRITDAASRLHHHTPPAANLTRLRLVAQATSLANVAWQPGLAGAHGGADLRPALRAPGQNLRPAPRAPVRPGPNPGHDARSGPGHDARLGPGLTASPILSSPHQTPDLASFRISSISSSPAARAAPSHPAHR